MARPDSARRLIVNADDFGLSSSVNQAVIRAHREGILTTASLMVNEPGFAEAVELARANPKLGVGLHLTLLMGHATLPAERISGLANAHGEFSNNPARTGFRFIFRRDLREQLRAEIRAQFARFRSTGLTLDHVNGHLHFHLHPTVLRILTEETQSLGIRRMRLTREPFWLDAPLAAGRRAYRASHAIIFSCLSGLAQRKLQARGIYHTERVFGLLQDSRVDEVYIKKLMPLLPPGDSELYSHPSLDKFRHEFDALVSPGVREQVGRLGIQLIRYQDL